MSQEQKKKATTKETQKHNRQQIKFSPMLGQLTELKVNFSFRFNEGKRKLWRLAQKDTKINNITSSEKKIKICARAQ